MDWKESLLPQRARIAFWAPLIAIILLVGIEVSPFAKATSSLIGNEDSDDDWLVEAGFQDDHILFNSDGDSETQESIGNYDQTPEDDDEMAILANGMNDDLSTWFLILIVILVLLIISLINDLRINNVINGRVIRGAGMGFIAIMSLFLISSIPEAVEKSFEELDDAHDDYEGGFWGEASTSVEVDEGDDLVLTTKWMPALGFWLLIPFFLVCLAGSIANLSYLKEDLECEELPIWFKSDEPPQFISTKLPQLGGYLVVMAIIVAMVAVVSPWYNIEQTWEGETSIVGENETSNSTYEVEWALNPFYVGFTNDTGIELGPAGESSFSIDSYSNHNELEKIAPIMLALRWPMICIGLIGGLFLARKLVNDLDRTMAGTTQGWSTLILFGMLITIQFGAGGFSEDMERTAEDDLDNISPSWLVEVSNPYAEDTIYGHQYSNSFYFEGNSSTSYSVEHTWGVGIGAYAANAFIWIALISLAISFGPQVFKSINESEPLFENIFEKEMWNGRPAIAGIIAILLSASLGAGMGELVMDSESAAPPGLFEWDINYTRNSGQVNQGAIMSDGETKQWEFDSGEMAKGNATEFSVYVTCGEGSQGAASDNPDAITWKVTPPSETVTSPDTTTLSGQIDCSGWDGGYSYFFAVFNIPEDGTIAETKEEVLSKISWDNMADGIWTLEITAEVNGGNFPFSEDSDLTIDFEARVQAYDSINAEAYD